MLGDIYYIADLTSKKEKLETLHKLISRLPELNYIVFERLIFHLARYLSWSAYIYAVVVYTVLSPDSIL